MRCNKCGRDIPHNSTRCIYCGAIIHRSTSRPEPKRADNIIIAIIIILVAALIAAAVALLLRRQDRSDNVFRGGNGGGTSVSINTKTPSTPVPTQRAVKTKAPVTPVPTPQRKNNVVRSTERPRTPAPTESSTALKRKKEFLKRADDIEQYQREHLERAMSQAELNNASMEVYNRWDALLNDVYQYLKNTLSTSSFEELSDDEEEWIIEKETAIREAAAEYGSGSMAPLAANITAIEYTQDRCYYLISLIY